MIDSILNLQLFAEGGEGAAPGVDSVPAEGVEGTTAEKTVTNEADDRKKAYKQFKSDYKAEYDADVQSMIKDRFKKINAETDSLKEHKSKTDKILEVLAVKYGKNADDIDGIVEKVTNDDSYYEDAAYDRGMDVKDFKKVKSIENENTRLKARAEQIEQENRQRAFAEKVYREEQIVRAKYPEFNLRSEMDNNSRFSQLVQKGVDMLSAYEVSHMDRFESSIKEKTAKEVANKMQSDAINNRNRPIESGARTPNAVQTKTNISKLSREQMAELKERARRGEKITLS